MRENSKSQLQEDVRVGKSQRKFLVFRVGAQKYSVGLSYVKEVIAFGQITPVPNMERAYLGMINLRGKLISVFNLATTLKLDSDLKVKRRSILIVELNRWIFGFAVDDASEVRSVDEQSIDRITDNMAKSEHFLGIIKCDDVGEGEGTGLIPILNLDSCFSKFNGDGRKAA